MPTKQNDHDLEPLLTNQQNQLNLLFGQGDGIDSKALGILGANVAIIIFINQAAAGLSFWQYVMLYSPFVFSLALDVLSIWPRRYKAPGIDLDTQDHFLGMNRKTLILQLLSNTQTAIKHNAALNKKRLRYCLGSVLLTGLGFLALLAIL